MNDAISLANMKENGLNWFDSYSNTAGFEERTIVIIQTVDRILTADDRSIYTRRDVFVKTNEIVQEYYGKRGLESIIVGPSGLGGTAEMLGLILTWILDHKDYLKYIPLMFKIGRTLYQKYKIHKSDKELALLRSKKFKVNLSLELYIEKETEIEDLVPLMEQFLLSTEKLYEKLCKEMDYASHSVSLGIHDLKNDKYINLGLGGTDSIKAFGSIIRRLEKSPASKKNIYVTWRKKFFWNTVTITSGPQRWSSSVG